MNVSVKEVNRFFMLASAPFLGMLLFMLFSSQTLQIRYDPGEPATTAEFEARAAQIAGDLDDAAQTALYVSESIRNISALYQKTTQTMAAIVKVAGAQADRPAKIYNDRITSKLGKASQKIESDKIRMELFYLNQDTYKGYALKVKLKDPKAMTMALGKDKVGGAETTLQAVKRYGAAAGINAGGFADGKGNRYPLSTTVLNGKYINGGFEASYKDLSFVGLNEQGKLIGGKFQSQQQLDKLKPSFGATFVPVLLKNGVKLAIPDKWKSSPKRAPRTVIGNYKDDQLLIIVADGYDEKGKSGATLEELQNKLSNLGVIDAYNLDGGGSSTLIFNGKIVNKPSDGKLRPVPTHFLFFK
ncbi:MULTISPECIES: phosphodiester glycosidase family protein [unclassified Paenibacillus]|uniref:phosphodiester glycosidase family protein n=1 Tax=unclassified Paenibacillus TaxID=185978 RepID=UPI001C103923|nr:MULTISPECIES: phosphodiester glycosidase family protein [unclassified Paenibacillus]MBU5442762.1 phosphodiester glycosidase family protein [Paenibacillus sp. MSJ-34]CAH0117835.1 hypothetical protein PAE9249_00296 [Paenibacillus sp. CECT 9249]